MENYRKCSLIVIKYPPYLILRDQAVNLMGFLIWYTKQY